MKASSLVKGIISRGGTATLKAYEVKEDLSYSQRENGEEPKVFTKYEVVGELNGHDIHMRGEECGFFTSRRISDRGYYDPGSDYNPSNYTFNNRIKDLDWIAEQPAPKLTIHPSWA